MGVLPAEASFFDKSVCVSTLVGGALLLVWLGGQITSRGIGNGISMIIFTGIVAELPSSLSNIFSSSGLGYENTKQKFVFRDIEPVNFPKSMTFNCVPQIGF